MNLNDEEIELLEDYENGEFKKDEEDLFKYKEIAKYTFKKDKRINIRLTTKDYEGLQKKALEEGIPYQTMVAGVIHKFLSSKLVEVD